MRLMVVCWFFMVLCRVFVWLGVVLMMDMWGRLFSVFVLCCVCVMMCMCYWLLVLRCWYSVWLMKLVLLNMMMLCIEVFLYFVVVM